MYSTYTVHVPSYFRKYESTLKVLSYNAVYNVVHVRVVVLSYFQYENKVIINSYESTKVLSKIDTKVLSKVPSVQLKTVYESTLGTFEGTKVLS